MKLINVIKPTHVCNLACTYCYNDDERRPFMDANTLSRTIEQTFLFAKKIGQYESVEFIWHGGEPLLAPLSYYEEAVLLQEKFSMGIKFSNIIQTNGTLIRDKHVNFFKKNKFQVSLSIDGIEEAHDSNRIDKNGHGSYHRVMKGFLKLESNGMKTGCVLVLNRKNKDSLEKSYCFFNKNKIGFNIIPLMKGGSASAIFDDISLTQEEYIESWTSLYNKWLSAPDNKYVDVSSFLHTTRSVISGSCSSCIGMAQCGIANLATDPLGNIYPCASVTGNNDVCYGNINDKTLAELFMSDKAIRWRNRTISTACTQCKWFHLCHGGCPSRSYHFNDGDYNIPDHYCKSISMIYNHVESRLLDVGIPAGEKKPDHLVDGFGNLDEMLLRK